MMHFFCPCCWKEIKESDNFCPFCKYELITYSSLSYEEKLIFALKHPVKEIRRTIVFLIGMKKLTKGIKELERMLFQEEDPIISLEIIKALENIGTKEAIKVIRKGKTHRNRLISKFCEQREFL